MVLMSVAAVARMIGQPYSAVYSYARRMGMPTDEGLTIDHIEQISAHFKQKKGS